MIKATRVNFYRLFVFETKMPIVVIVLLAALTAFLVPARPPGNVGGAYTAAYPQLPLAPARSWPVPKLKFSQSELELSARAALVKDINSDVVLYEKAPHEQLPIASLTKLLTALLVRVKGVPADVIVAKASDLEVVPHHANLPAGEEFLAYDLLGVMLVASANDATLALARHYGGTVAEFVELMNDEARRLGMLSSHFSNPIGLDDTGHYSTALDLTYLVEEFLTDPVLMELVGLPEITVRSSSGSFTAKLPTTNQLLLENKNIRGIKTGYTEEAKGNLILLVEEPGRPYYLVLLGSDNREAEASSLINWVEENFVWE